MNRPFRLLRVGAVICSPWLVAGAPWCSQGFPKLVLRCALRRWGCDQHPLRPLSCTGLHVELLVLLSAGEPTWNTITQSEYEYIVGSFREHKVLVEGTRFVRTDDRAIAEVTGLFLTASTCCV